MNGYSQDGETVPELTSLFHQPFAQGVGHRVDLDHLQSSDAEAAHDAPLLQDKSAVIVPLERLLEHHHRLRREDHRYGV